MAAPSPEIWLIRHGETEWSGIGRHTGRTDLPLTAVGERQAAALRRPLAAHRFALVLSSPLRRAWDTCRLAGFEAVAHRADDLMEWDYGAFEGFTADQIRAERPGWSLWADGAPGGETVEQVAERARRITAQALQAGGDVALFAHGHLLRILATCWMGRPLAEAGSLKLGTATLGILGRDGEAPVLRAWNVAPGDLPQP